jgi:hypothetical protein
MVTGPVNGVWDIAADISSLQGSGTVSTSVDVEGFEHFIADTSELPLDASEATILLSDSAKIYAALQTAGIDPSSVTGQINDIIGHETLPLSLIANNANALEFITQNIANYGRWNNALSEDLVKHIVLEGALTANESVPALDIDAADLLTLKSGVSRGNTLRDLVAHLVLEQGLTVEQAIALMPVANELENRGFSRANYQGHLAEAVKQNALDVNAIHEMLPLITGDGSDPAYVGPIEKTLNHSSYNSWTGNDPKAFGADYTQIVQGFDADILYWAKDAGLGWEVARAMGAVGEALRGQGIPSADYREHLLAAVQNGDNRLDVEALNALAGDSASIQKIAAALKVDRLQDALDNLSSWTIGWGTDERSHYNSFLAGGWGDNEQAFARDYQTIKAAATVDEAASVTSYSQQVYDVLNAGSVKPPMHKLYGFEETSEALLTAYPDADKAKIAAVCYLFHAANETTNITGESIGASIPYLETLLVSSGITTDQIYVLANDPAKAGEVSSLLPNSAVVKGTTNFVLGALGMVGVGGGAYDPTWFLGEVQKLAGPAPAAPTNGNLGVTGGDDVPHPSAPAATPQGPVAAVTSWLGFGG